MDKQKIEEKKQILIDLVRKFCAEKLNEEYAELSKKLIQKLGRKRNVPFITGKLEIWAAAVIHALGTINFLFDKSSKPYVSIDDINDYFGTKKSTTGGKSKEIRDLLKLNYWDNEFSTEEIKESNPFAKLVMVDGLMVPLSAIPEHLQQIVKQARENGKDISFRTD